MTGYPLAAALEPPKTLSNKDWQKKKGLTKLTKSTGLGAELTKFEELHKKIDTVVMDASTNPLPSNEQELAKKIVKAKDHYVQTVEPVRKQLAVVEKKALATKVALKDAIGASSAIKAADEIAKDAASFSMILKGLDLKSTVETARLKMARKREQANNQLIPYVKKYLNEVKTYTDGSKSGWDEKLKPAARSVSQYVEELPQYNKAFFKDLQAFEGFDLIALKLDGTDEESAKARLKKARDFRDIVARVAVFRPVG